MKTAGVQQVKNKTPLDPNETPVVRFRRLSGYLVFTTLPLSHFKQVYVNLHADKINVYRFYETFCYHIL